MKDDPMTSPVPALGRFQSAVAKVEAGAAYLTSEYLVARLCEAMQSAAVRMHSPWLNRQDAADYARCGVSEVDRAANLGFIKKHMRGGAPLFKRSEIDSAITEGRWLPAKSGK